MIPCITTHAIIALLLLTTHFSSPFGLFPQPFIPSTQRAKFIQKNHSPFHSYPASSSPPLPSSISQTSLNFQSTLLNNPSKILQKSPSSQSSTITKFTRPKTILAFTPPPEFIPKVFLSVIGILYIRFLINRKFYGWHPDKYRYISQDETFKDLKLQIAKEKKDALIVKRLAFQSLLAASKASNGGLDDGSGSINELQEDEDPVISKTLEKNLSAFRCKVCSFTIFPALGRNDKFFPSNFKCPGCGGGVEGFEERRGDIVKRGEDGEDDDDEDEDDDDDEDEEEDDDEEYDDDEEEDDDDEVGMVEETVNELKIEDQDEPIQVNLTESSQEIEKQQTVTTTPPPPPAPAPALVPAPAPTPMIKQTLTADEYAMLDMDMDFD